MNTFKFINKKNDQRVQKYFYKCNLNHRITKIIREVYLRNDISCGIEKCNICENKKKKLLDGERDILILDMNTIIKYMDFLYDCNIDNILIPITIYEHIRAFNKILYNKLHELCYEIDECSPNCNKRYSVFVNKFCKFTYVDNKDESIEQIQGIIKIVIWLKHHNSNLNIIVITNNKFLKEDCMKNDISCFTLFKYVRQLKRNIKEDYFKMDILKMYFEEDMINENNKENIIEEYESVNKDNIPSNKKPLFDPYLNKTEIIQKLREKKIIKGIFNVICVNKLAVVKYSDLDEIVIRGAKNMNRAIQNDIVAVEIVHEENEETEEEDYFEELISPEEEEEEEENDTLMNEKKKKLSNKENKKNKKNNESKKDEQINEEKKEIKELNDKKKLYGKVVGIISRGRKEYGGIVKEYSKDKNIHIKKLRFFKAFNNKIPFIIIKTSLTEELRNKRVIAVIDKWDIYSKYPIGRCLSVLGNCDDIETETQLIYNEYNISNKEFSESAYKCLPPSQWQIPEEEFHKRKDFRNVLTFSIDPPGCQDIDDALSLEISDDKTFIKVGIHIADVSYFVKQNSPLDIEASKRCTTVYLINQRVDMLPKLLTTNLCSLVENQDRLTYSCIFCFDDNYNIVDVSVSKCIIKSNKSFTYEEAQNVINDKNDNSKIAEALRLLNSIAKHLKKQWIDQGALELRGSTEVMFEFEANDFSKTKNLKPYVSYDTNKLIETFMLLANKSIAKIIFQNFKAASILRRHPPPKKEHLKELSEYLQSIDVYDFKYDTSKELSHSLNNINLKNDQNLSNILKVLVTKCMNEAVFISGYNVHNNEMLKHYGLAAEIYTFFTSPIRRYADIMVHRILNHIYNIEPLHSKYLDIIYLNKQITLLNEKHRNARFASRASVDFFSYLYIKKIGNQITNAIITNLKKNGIQIYVPTYSTEGICYLKKKDGFIFEEKKKRFKKVDENSKEIFYLNFYDHVQVHMQVDSYDIKCQNQFIFIKKL
ncbi:exosome complex exonuclease RRP44, putative [Plasmodium relictum]|uniref:Exosome complex exonuclease RRP44, putative n=1 Tax=Plasmodium relictum TaxID=85471 RepID=A0A1J1H737_PLARL|nr:exosome complex exonuclease RRP44, putative [Plasmodium relictum]CRH00766.1 exosome complex exonuclease RRP44, putative [Plasmodium relictum]